MKDADGKELEIGKIYALSDAPDCTNRFRCVATDVSVNETMFIREHDNSEFKGREFIEFQEGKPYFAVSAEVSHDVERRCDH